MLTWRKAAGLSDMGELEEGCVLEGSWQPCKSSVVSGSQRKGRRTSRADLVLRDEPNG